jgi:hypothetical protein
MADQGNKLTLFNVQVDAVESAKDAILGGEFDSVTPNIARDRNVVSSN